MAIKRVLITGSNSYVGTNVEKWLMKEPDKFYVETISVRGDAWKAFDFSKFDVVFHVAGIAHVSQKRSMKDLYYTINRDLAFDVANKAKNSGVKHFIFMSSMIVYNSKETKITKETLPNPDNFYGRSKLEAENQIKLLLSDSFKIAIIRPPMIFGPGSKGNYRFLVNHINHILFFPKINNSKSILFIYNFCIFIRSIILDIKSGDFFPHNSDVISTTKLVLLIGEFSNKKVYILKFCHITNFLMFIPKIRKIFGNHYYEIPNDRIYYYSNNESIKFL